MAKKTRAFSATINCRGFDDQLDLGHVGGSPVGVGVFIGRSFHLEQDHVANARLFQQL